MDASDPGDYVGYRGHDSQVRDEAVQCVNPAFDLVQQQGPARPIVVHRGGSKSRWLTTTLQPYKMNLAFDCGHTEEGSLFLDARLLAE